MLLRFVDGDADSISHGDDVYEANADGLFHVPEDVGRVLVKFPHMEEYVGDVDDLYPVNAVGDAPPDDHDALVEENRVLRVELAKALDAAISKPDRTPVDVDAPRPDAKGKKDEWVAYALACEQRLADLLAGDPTGADGAEPQPLDEDGNPILPPAVEVDENGEPVVDPAAADTP